MKRSTLCWILLLLAAMIAGPILVLQDGPWFRRPALDRSGRPRLLDAPGPQPQRTRRR